MNNLKDDLLELLTGNVSDEILHAVRELFPERTCESESTKYENVRDYSFNLFNFLNQEQRGIVANDPNEEVCAIFMNKCRVERLMEHIPPDGYLTALPGKYKNLQGNEVFTIALLAADNQHKILSAHIGGDIDGEEAWSYTQKFNKIDETLPIRNI